MDYESKEEESGYANKNSREEIIEYNPDELSDDASDSDSDIDNHYLMLNHNSIRSLNAPDKDLTVSGKAAHIYECKNFGKNF